MTKEIAMRLKLGLLTLAIALVVVAGIATGIWLWADGQAMAETGAQSAAVEKSDVPKAQIAKADDDDEEEAEDGDDDDGDDEEEGDDEGKEDENEVTVTLDQVPAPVRDAIRAEAGDNPIKEIEAETKNGQTIYEAEWVASGKEVELKLSADGKIIEKKVEDADDDDDEEEESD